MGERLLVYEVPCVASLWVVWGGGEQGGWPPVHRDIGGSSVRHRGRRGSAERHLHEEHRTLPETDQKNVRVTLNSRIFKVKRIYSLFTKNKQKNVSFYTVMRQKSLGSTSSAAVRASALTFWKKLPSRLNLHTTFTWSPTENTARKSTEPGTAWWERWADGVSLCLPLCAACLHWCSPSSVLSMWWCWPSTDNSQSVLICQVSQFIK